MDEADTTPDEQVSTAGENAGSVNLQDEGLKGVTAVVRRAAAAVLGLPSWAFIGLLALWAVVRAGVRVYGDSHTAGSAAALPAPFDYTSTGLTGPVLYRALDLGNLSWTVLSAVLIVATAAAPVITVGRRSIEPQAWRLAAVMVACWQVPAASLQMIGHYQSVMVLALTMSVLASRTWSGAVWAAVAAVSGPEQALVAYACLLVATFTAPFRAWRATAVIGTALSATWLVLSTLWLQAGGVTARGGFLSSRLIPSVAGGSMDGLLGVYAWWGPWWLLVALVAAALPRRQRLLLLVAAVVLPGLATFITWDGTRVFASITAALGVVFVLTYLNCARKPARQADTYGSSPWHRATHFRESFAMWLVALLVLPAVVSYFGGTSFRAPWTYPVKQAARVLGLAHSLQPR